MGQAQLILPVAFSHKDNSLEKINKVWSKKNIPYQQITFDYKQKCQCNKPSENLGKKAKRKRIKKKKYTEGMQSR